MEDQTAALIIVTGIIDRRQWLAVGPEVGDTKSYNGPFCFLAKSFRSLRISVFHTVEPNPNSEDDDAIINLPDIRQRSVDLLHFVDRKHRRRDKITPSAANTAGKLDDLASDSAPPVLIFAGHDLGGIVVKQALLTANSKARFDWIVSACISVVFVETPHYAPDLHAWERTILRMLGLVEGSFDFVSFFKYLPAFASRVEEDFQDAFESLPVINFYTKASPLYNVTNKGEGPLRFTGHDKTELLDYDISESWSIREHESAAETIRKVMSGGIANRQATANDSDIKKLLSFLAEVTPNMRALWSFVNRSVSSAFSEWIQETDWYRDWMAKTSNSVLHIASPSGSGTAALVSKTVRRLRRNGEIVLGFSMLSVPEHLRSDGEASSAILFSALCQLLLQQVAHKGQRFFPSYLSFYSRAQEELCFTKTVLRGLLSSLLSSQDSRSPVFCVIHGIHLLLEDDQKQLFRDLEMIMASSQPSFKLLITTDGQPLWQTIPELRHGSISIQLQEAQERHDVRNKYSVARIERLALSRPVWSLSEPNLKKMLVTKLCAESVTMLELSLKLDLIELTETAETTSDVESMISGLPLSLTGIVDAIFQRRAHLHSVASAALEWILSSSRPLSPSELSVCVGLGICSLQTTECGSLRGRISLNPSKDLQLALGPVIDVSEETVRLRHHSLANILRGRKYLKIAADSHFLILSECLSYLKLVGNTWRASITGQEDLEDSRELLLVEYAAVHWPDHGFLSNDKEGATSLIFDFLQSAFFDTWVAMLLYYSPPVALHSGARVGTPWSAVEAACYFGFSGVVDKFIEKTPPSESLRKELTRGLEFATQRGHVSIVQRILGEKIRSNDALRIAARFGQRSVLEALIRSLTLDIESKDEAGFNPLLEACRGGNFGVVKLLMQQGASVKTTSITGLTPLHLACRTGQAEIVGELTTSGDALLNSKDQLGYTPLMYAAEGGFEHIVQNLISGLTVMKSDPEEEDWSLEVELDRSTSEGNTALHLATSNGHLKTVDLLLRRGASPAKENGIGYTPLHLAAKLGLLEITKLLINASQKATSQEDDMTAMSQSSLVAADSPLKLAVANRHIGVVRELLRSQLHRSPESAFQAVSHACKAGYLDTVIDILVWYKQLDPSSAVLRDEHGTTALHLGAQFKNLTLVEKILVGGLVPVNSPDKLDWTPLHTAAMHGDDEIVKTLLAWKASVQSETTDGMTSLHLAARHGHAGACQVLGEKCKELLRAKSKDVDLPVFLAAKEGHIDAVGALLRLAPETGQQGLLHLAVQSGSQALLETVLDTKPELNWVSSDGDTAAHLAVSEGHISMIRSLHKEGADMTRKDGKGRTLLFRAVEEGNVDMVKALTGLDTNLNPDETDERGLTPFLQICASFSYTPNVAIELARVLLTKYGTAVNINATHPDSGRTPLHFSIYNQIYNEDSEDLTMLLLENNANPNIRNHRGSTPIFLAAELGKFRSVEALIQRNAEVSIKNKSNTTPLHRAAGGNHAECVKLLLEHGAGADLDHKNNYGYTPLALSAVNGYTETVKMLLEHDADWNIENDDELTPLAIAAGADEEETVDELLRAMARKPSDIHQTIRRAAINGHADIVDMLVRKYGDPNIGDETHGSILGLAIAREQYDTAKILLAIPDVNVDIRDPVGRTPLFMAVEKENVELVEALTAASADPNANTKEDICALTHAITKQNTTIVNHLLGAKDIDLTQVDGRGYGALYWASRRGTDEIFTLIHEAAKKHPSYNSMCQLAIYGAVASDNHFAFNALAEQGIDYDAPDADGWTLLYTARCYELPSMEKKLIEKGAENEARPKNIKTPTAWHGTDKGAGLSTDQASPNTIVVQEMSRQMSDDDYRNSVARADHPLPGDEDWYFEVTIQQGYRYDDDEQDVGPLGVGIAEDSTDRWQWLGFGDDGEGHSYGFHADDGNTYPYQATKQMNNGEFYRQDDTIGCGYVRSSRAVYFTRNGKRLGQAFDGVQGKFYPAVFMLTSQVGVSISANFTNSPPWKFDLKSPRLRPSEPPEQENSDEDSNGVGSPKSSNDGSLFGSDDDD